MNLDSNLRIEVISSILGQSFQPYDRKRYKRTADILSVDDFHLNTITGKRKRYAKERFIDEEEFFDPQFDVDFTDFSDSAECRRGEERYKRPKGWYRMALKVRGKYPDGDSWLGTNGWRSQSVPGEWPVSYHGTSLAGVKGIIWSHYKAGDRTLYGRGIYSTPDIHFAEREDYAKTFTSKTTGKSYKVILQNRINPEKREICKRSDHWLIRVHKRTSAEEEKQIVENSIRPYGILIKEINTDDDTGQDDRGDDDTDDDDRFDDDTGDEDSVDDYTSNVRCYDDRSDHDTDDESRGDDDDSSDDDTVDEDRGDDDTADEDRGDDDDDSGDDDTVDEGRDDDDSVDDYISDNVRGDDDTGDEDRGDDDDRGDDYTTDEGRGYDDSGDDGTGYDDSSYDD